jgi:hypothetical protein
MRIYSQSRGGARLGIDLPRLQGRRAVRSEHGLSDDRCQIQNPLAQIAVSPELYLLAS